MLRALAVAFIGIWGVSFTPAAAFAASSGCKLGVFLTIPVTMNGLKPVAEAQVNGHDIQLVVDSGAFFSMLTPSAAEEFKLPLRWAPIGLTVNGLGGAMVTPQVTTVTVTLAGVALPHKWDFIVGGNEVGGGARGLLGQNILRAADIEYDLANGVVRLIRPEGSCKKMRPTYWAKEDQAYSVMDINSATPGQPHTTGTGFLNGAKISVMFDTGASTSMLSLRAAERAGIKPDSPGVRPGGTSFGVGQGYVKTWIAPFQSFKIGDEEIRNTHLRMGDIQLTIADMMIGADFFLSHRVYVATGEHKLYFTYNGGPVFNLTTALADANAGAHPKPGTEGPPAPPQNPPGTSDTNTAPTAGDGQSPADQENNDPGAAGEASAGQDLPGGEPLGADASAGQERAIPGGQPTTAEEFFRRGSAYTSRHDYTHALADLHRACELDPSEAKYFFARAQAYWLNRQHDLSDADIDTTLKLKPDQVNALLWRAQRKLSKKDEAGALADLDAVDKAAAPQADIRMALGRLYQADGQLPAAIKQYGLWIDSHNEDIALAAAYTLRCWARALSGQDLDQALSDCNRSLHRASDNPGTLASRGLVYLRLGKFDRAISDYSAALKQRPKNAWALYGRGLAESQEKKTAAADADFGAAKALAPHIAEQFTKRGIAP